MTPYQREMLRRLRHAAHVRYLYGRDGLLRDQGPMGQRPGERCFVLLDGACYATLTDAIAAGVAGEARRIVQAFAPKQEAGL